MSRPPEPGSADRFPPAELLRLTVESSDSTMLLRIAGELDVASAGQVTTVLDRLDAESTTRLVLDLREIAFLDLAGLRAILSAHSRCTKQQIGFTVVRPRGFASRLFTLTGAHRELDLVDSHVLGHHSDTDNGSTPAGGIQQEP